MKIIYEDKEIKAVGTDDYMSVIKKLENNLTRAFQREYKNEKGVTVKNSNFKKEVEAFAGKGFLDA